MRVMAMKELALDLLFPKHCLGCGREGSFLCATCRPGLMFQAPSCLGCSERNFDGILTQSCREKTGIRRFLAPLSYRDPLTRELIHAYKYEGVRELANLFADEITSFLRFYGIRIPKDSVLVPIPLHRSRLAERGFNQAELLARAIGERIGLALAPELKRTRLTEQQIHMPSYVARRANIRNAFSVSNPERIRAKTVIVVDDVATSGGTLSEAAHILREAGAKTVWTIAIAKG